MKQISNRQLLTLLRNSFMNPLTQAQIQEIFALIDQYPNSQATKNEVLQAAVKHLNLHKRWDEVLTELTALLAVALVEAPPSNEGIIGEIKPIKQDVQSTRSDSPQAPVIKVVASVTPE